MGYLFVCFFRVFFFFVLFFVFSVFSSVWYHVSCVVSCLVSHEMVILLGIKLQLYLVYLYMMDRGEKGVKTHLILFTTCLSWFYFDLNVSLYYIFR